MAGTLLVRKISKIETMNTRLTKRSASSNDNLPPLLNANKKRKEESPITKRMRKAWEETQQKEAFKDLLLIRGANGGKLKFKDMKDLVKKYKRKGYAAVSRDNLYYRLRCYKAAKIDKVIGSSVTLTGR
jgi:hypothetical protein